MSLSRLARRVLAVLTLGAFFVLATFFVLANIAGPISGDALAQGNAAPGNPAAPGGWPTELELRRSLDSNGRPVAPRSAPPPAAATTPWGATSTVAPGSAAPAGTAPAAVASAAIRLSAFLTQDGEPIDQGLIWRIYREPKPSSDGRIDTPALVSTSRVPVPVVRLEPGAYVINVAYGRAHLTRKVAVISSRPREERFVLNAGGLRVSCFLAGGSKPPDNSVTYDVFHGEADQLGRRKRIVAGLKPGLIVRLNAGLYHIASTLGDANASVLADVTVEAGKLTDAVLTHNAARVTLKLVTRAGGEAQADTLWALHTNQGDLVRETQGALPAHFLAAGQYIASARHGGRLYQQQFTVSAGVAAQEVEVVMK